MLPLMVPHCHMVVVVVVVAGVVVVAVVVAVAVVAVVAVAPALENSPPAIFPEILPGGCFRTGLWVLPFRCRMQTWT